MNFLQRMMSFMKEDKLQKLRELQDRYNYRRAMELLDSDEQQAYDYLKKEVEDCDCNGYAHYWIGHLFFRKESYGQALKYTNDAIGRLKGDDEWLGACFVLRARINENLGKEQDMLDDLATAINHFPKESTPYEIRAEWYYSKKDYDKSDADYRKLTELTPDNPYPHAALGRSLLFQGKVEEARAKFEYCIKLAPDYASGYAFLADCQLRQGDVCGCVENALEALRNNREDKKALYLLESISDEDFNILVSHLKVLCQSEPNNTFWPFLLGMNYLYREYFYEAIECYKESYRIELNPFTLAYIADAYTSLGDYRRAEVHYRRALESQPNHDGLHEKLAFNLVHQMRCEEALQELMKCNELQPGNVKILYTIADVHRMMKHFDEAKKYAEMAIGLDSKITSGLMSLARIYEMTGETEELKRTLEKIVNHDVPNPREKTIALAMLGRWNEADELLAKDWSMDTRQVCAAFYLDKAGVLVIEGRIDEAREALLESIAYGMRDFECMKKMDILQWLYKIPDFENILDDANRQKNGEFFEQNRLICHDEEDEGSDTIIAVPFVSEDGMCKVVGEVNGLPLSFVFDTGASGVTISSLEATFMQKNGYLEEKDFAGTVNYRTASGDVLEGSVVNLRCIKVGQLTLTDVRATVIKNPGAPLLLGQSVLGRYAKVEVDNESKVIRFTNEGMKTIEPEEMHSWAVNEMLKGNYKEAAQLFRSVYVSTEDENAINLETTCYNELGWKQKAIDVAEEAFERFPDSWDSHYMYAYSLYCGGRLEESVNQFQRLTLLHPDSVDGWIMLTYALNRTGRYEESVRYADEALMWHSDSANLYHQRAIALERMGREEEAKRDFEIAAEEPYDPNHGIVAAEALLHLGRKDECKENIQSALSVSQEYAPMYRLRVLLDAAEYYAEMGDNDEAWRLFTQVLEGPSGGYLGFIRSQFDYEGLRNLPGFDEVMQQYELFLEEDIIETAA